MFQVPTQQDTTMKNQASTSAVAVTSATTIEIPQQFQHQLRLLFAEFDKSPNADQLIKVRSAVDRVLNQALNPLASKKPSDVTTPVNARRAERSSRKRRRRRHRRPRQPHSKGQGETPRHQQHSRSHQSQGAGGRTNRRRNQRRQDNIVIHGLIHSDEVPTNAAVKELVSDFFDSKLNIDVDFKSVHAMGRNFQKPVRVVLRSPAQAKKVIRANLPKLKAFGGGYAYRVTDDLTFEERLQLRPLHSQLNQAKLNGHRVRLDRNFLYIDGIQQSTPEDVLYGPSSAPFGPAHELVFTATHFREGSVQSQTAAAMPIDTSPAAQLRALVLEVSQVASPRLSMVDTDMEEEQKGEPPVWTEPDVPTPEHLPVRAIAEDQPSEDAVSMSSQSITSQQPQSRKKSVLRLPKWITRK